MPDSISTDELRKMLAELSDVANKQQQHDATLTGWPGLAKSVFAAPLDKLLAVAVAIGLGYIIWKGPMMFAEITASNQRTFQEERERDRQFNAAQTKQLSDAMLKLSNDISRLEQSTQRLERAIQRPGGVMGGQPDETPPDPCLLPWWDRLRDGAAGDVNAPVD